MILSSEADITVIGEAAVTMRSRWLV